MTNELNVLALIKGNEHYIFVYDDDSRPEVIDTFRDQAADPALSFNWFDAMVLTTKAREQETMEATPFQESGVRDQESGVRDQESGVRDQESGVRDQESGVRSQEAKDNSHSRIIDL